MYTIKLKVADGLQLITGFDTLPIDPAASKKEKKTVYAELRENEKLATSSEIEILKSKFSGLGKKELLLVSGEVIYDNRGLEFWEKDSKGAWSSVVCELVEAPKKGALFMDLAETDRAEILEQKELKRLENLSAEERTAEKQSALQSALRKAAMYKTELEILGDPDALMKSQTMYAAERSVINAKYDL